MMLFKSIHGNFLIQNRGIFTSKQLKFAQLIKAIPRPAPKVPQPSHLKGNLHSALTLLRFTHI